MKKELRRLLGEAGISMLEVIMAAAIMAGIALTMTKIAQNTQKAGKNTEIKGEYGRITTEVATTLRRGVDCQLTLSNVPIPVAPVAADWSVDLLAIMQCRNPQRVQLAAPNDDIFVQQCSADVGASRTRYQNNQQVSNGNSQLSLTLEDLQLDPVVENNGGLASGSANVVLNFTKTDMGKKTSIGGGDFSRKIPVVFDYDTATNRVVSCYNNSDNMINTAVVRSCTGNNARLIGTEGNPQDPVRCVHEVNSVTCGDNEFLSIVDVDDSQTVFGECIAITDKKSGCSTGEYLREGANSIECYAVPVCNEQGKHLVSDADGNLTCQPLLNCGKHEVLVTDDNNDFKCVKCNPGEVIVQTTSGLQCKKPICGNAGDEGQQYFVGFNTDGSPMCRTLIKANDKACGNGGRLVISGGTVEYECCPGCNSSESGNYCHGETFVSTNECGSLCEGSKPSVNGQPSSWGRWSGCGESSFTKRRTRTCEGAECGGDECTADEMTDLQDCRIKLAYDLSRRGIAIARGDGVERSDNDSINLPGVERPDFRNKYDKPFYLACTYSVLYGLVSSHSNRHEDRKWGAACVKMKAVAQSGETASVDFSLGHSEHHDHNGAINWADNATSFINDWDRPIKFICPNNGLLNGMYSEHSNKKEDRRFKFHCATNLGSTSRTGRKFYRRENCEWTPELNEYDKDLALYCPKNKILSGIESVHSNRHEDRRWKAYCCDFVYP